MTIGLCQKTDNKMEVWTRLVTLHPQAHYKAGLIEGRLASKKLPLHLVTRRDAHLQLDVQRVRSRRLG